MPPCLPCAPKNTATQRRCRRIARLLATKIMTKTIFVKPVGGLCNRIRVIDSLLAIANQNQKKLVVIWERSPTLNCSYLDLFQPTEKFELIETRPKRGWAFPLFPSRQPTGFLKRLLHGQTQKKYQIETEVFFDQLASKIDSLRPVSPEKYPDIHAFDKCSYDLFVDLRATLKEDSNCFLTTCWRVEGDPCYGDLFQPADKIAAKIDEITSRFGGSTIGVHIRGTDAETTKKYSSVEAFKDAMNAAIEHDPETDFFLATDEPAIKTDLIKTYGDRLHFFDQPDYSRNSPENIENALVDLLCLASTKQVFGSYFSTFSQLAAQWNGVEENTIFRSDLGKQQRDSVTEN